MRLTRLLTPLLAVAVALPVSGCGNDSDTTAPVARTVETTTFAPSLGIDLNAAGWTRTNTGLYYRTLSSPAGNAATVDFGQSITVRYTGWLANGTQFESSSIGPFIIGRGAVIGGWDQGIVGMRVGERRRLLIPPALGYGAQGSGPIPGNAVLVFDVEVLSAA
jgi:peptidylprolyl isomerase